MPLYDEVDMADLFDEGFGRKVAGLIGGWKGGGGYVTPGGSGGEYAGRTGMQDDPEYGALDSIAAMWRGPDAFRIARNAPVRPAVLTDEGGGLWPSSKPKTREYVEPRLQSIFGPVQPKLAYQPLREDIGVEGLASKTQLAMGIRSQEDADKLAAAFLHVPVEQIPEDYEFLKAQRGMGAGTPRELRSRLRRMSEEELRENLFGKRTAVDLNTPFGASGTGWGRTSRQKDPTIFDDRALMDPAWSVGVQHLEDRFRGGGATREGERILPQRRGFDRPKLFAARGPLPEDDGIVSLDALTRARQ